jgi:hypothetical protein
VLAGAVATVRGTRPSAVQIFLGLDRHPRQDGRHCPAADHDASRPTLRIRGRTRRRQRSYLHVQRVPKRRRSVVVPLSRPTLRVLVRVATCAPAILFYFMLLCVAGRAHAALRSTTHAVVLSGRWKDSVRGMCAQRTALVEPSAAYCSDALRTRCAGQRAVDRKHASGHRAATRAPLSAGRPALHTYYI